MNNRPSMRSRGIVPDAGVRERGATIVIALIALLALLFSGMALIRSLETTLAVAGNMAFKRDLVNRGEIGLQKARAAFSSSASATGGLYTAANRLTSSTSNNYSATRLAVDPVSGVPTALLGNDTTFATVGATSNDYTDGDVTVRYVVDRQCSNTGEPSLETCVMYSYSTNAAGGSDYLLNRRAGVEMVPVYRISVRVTGARGTVAYLQSTVAK
jgi:type IV pilus assembly protein PilX